MKGKKKKLVASFWIHEGLVWPWNEHSDVCDMLMNGFAPRYSSTQSTPSSILSCEGFFGVCNWRQFRDVCNTIRATGKCHRYNLKIHFLPLVISPRCLWCNYFFFFCPVCFSNVTPASHARWHWLLSTHADRTEKPDRTRKQNLIKEISCDIP